MAHSLIQRTHLLLVLLVFLCRSSADSKGTPKLIREKREPSFKVVAAGYSVDLDCRFKDPHSLDSVTLSKVSTGKQTPRIVDGVKISKSGQIFTINDFQKSDEGIYWCKLGSWSYRIESLYVVSRTQPGNYILTQSTVPENITTINEGDNVTIVCKVSGNGIKRVEWYKDKKELPSRYNNTGDFNVSIADLTAVTVAQAGEYECRTSIIPTPYFGYQAESFVLQVIGFHFLAKNKKYQRLFVGDKVTINCNTNVQKATSTLWVRKDIRPSKQVMPNGSTITRKGNSFLLSSLTQDDAGSYVCKATSSLLEKTIEEEITTLLIFTDDQGKPLAQVYPVVGEVFSGQNVNISCQAPGNAVSMEWSRKGQIVSSIQTHRKIRKTAKGNFTESTLVLTNVSKVDNGTYTCTVTTSQNMGYSNQATATLLVTECHESDKFADPSDISGYFECKHGAAVKKSCPGNHVWNQEDKKCKLWHLDWVHDKDGKRVVILDTNTPFELDCQLNDPRVTVTVTVQLKTGNQNVDPQNDINVTQSGQKFRIDVSSLSSGNNMELKCQALGSGGQVVSKKTVTLVKAKDFQNNVFVQILPVCSPGPLAIHDSISIICHAYHFGDMGWYKIDKSSTVRKAISDSDPRLKRDQKWTRHGHWNVSKTLTLDNVTKNDEGAYVCWKSNGYNITKNITVYIDVADPSPATIEKLDSPPQSFIKEGQNASFHCTVSGSPRPNVTWRRGQEIVAFCAGKYNSACETVGSRYKANWRDDRGCMLSYSMGPVSGGWVSWLTVNNLQYPADVKYTCVVENSLGKEEKVASRKIAVAPVLQGNTNNGPEKVYGVQDREEEIKCITERSNPPATFKWRYQPLNCSLSSSSCPKPTNNWNNLTDFGDIKNRSDNMSVLILPGYLKNMYFNCIAENPVTRAKASKQYQFMRQTGEVSSFLDVKPEPSMIKSEGSNITLRCEATIGYFMGWPSWNFKGKTFDTNSDNRKYVNRSKDMNWITELIIRDVKPSDRGLYVCSARSELEDGKELQKSIELTVIALSKPNVNISANLTRLKKGQAAELSCNVTGNPNPEISWFRNGEKIETKNTIGLVEDCKQLKSGFYKIKDEEVEKYGVLESRLVVCSAAHLNHTGSYTCEAHNSIGNDTATAYVNILEKPSVTVLPPREVESGVTELRCTATGNPTPLIYWEKQESEGSSFVPVQGKGGQGMKNVNVIRVKKGSEDLYRCVANNSQGIVYSKEATVEPEVRSVKQLRDGGISKESTIVMITCVGFVVIVFFLLCLILYKRKKKYGGFYLLTLPPSPDYIMKLDPERSLLEQTNKLPYDAQWEFPRERVHIAKPLGSGAFGQVFLAQATGIVAFDPRGSTKRKPGRRRSRFGSTSRPYYNDKRVTAVAVKSLKDNATEAEYRDLLSELKILIHIGEHKNIVNLLGACTKGMERELWVIIEYCPHGNLLDFLRKRRDIFEPVWTTPTEHADVTFSTIDLYICSLQVARAMEFLASRRCVHRDLAARNVLVGENYVLKVADFGLARDIYKEEHYVKTTAGLLPVKWMAIEALVDRIYTHKSDVWSFGVLLWELFTLGGSPYPGLPANEVYQYLMEGQRMDNPLNCPDEMYEIMRNCWDHSPDERASFTDLVARIDKLLEDRTSESGEGYLDLEHAEDEPNLDEPTFEDEYLDPGQTLLPSPGSPTSEERMNYPLPPLPSEEIEMGTFEEPIKDEEKKKFVLLDPPREKRIARMDSELEKVRKDTLEREKPKDSVGHYNEDEFISEKEQLRSDDDDKDICERNSGVFEFSPDYEARHSHSLDVPPQENAYYGEQRPPSQGEVTFKAGNGFRGRQPSNRYVNS